MQKTKLLILSCLLEKPSDRFEIRKYIANHSKPTNSREVIRQLDFLEKNKFIINQNGIYTLYPKGEVLLDLLKKINNLL